ncbi:hypothetical protein FC62_GL001284 [Amylolactobacillus amylotrophicus DSM 20534]|uniref:Uncharacterized protein n=3 Tax=Amylolactobacillus TaxID=2767876 RepID=A0A0R1YIZ0_9LACO|nr:MULTISPECIES: cell division protein ZapA [Amylolactobacillus]APT18061.1 hypothetical protein LA20533_01640 [Amylolactobacillus amylophilus DSM 20533 = JCM 1125]KRK37406.1 hypothetical protein FC62_GL001284 [Amylolactobacillus amylotrophicus DSM 20534]KRM42079.1 hypothetical protein FD40_GL000863 [Amylolactobacillus amylophilus DSM 20533 = JCM 1125]GED80580.1 hypothetical protein LAM01_10530 [Amylolactobacillus amylophilus]
MQKRRYKAKIGEKNYIIVGPGSEEHMAAVTNYLNEQLAQLKRLSPGITLEEASVLLAFNAVSTFLKQDRVDSEDHAHAPKNTQWEDKRDSVIDGDLFDDSNVPAKLTKQESD